MCNFATATQLYILTVYETLTSHYDCFYGLFNIGHDGNACLSGKIKRIQPDGTAITTLLMGDEHHSCISTTDGYAIQMADDGYYHYLTRRADQRLTTEGMPIVRGESGRSAADKLLLEKAVKTSEVMAFPAATPQTKMLSNPDDDRIQQDAHA